MVLLLMLLAVFPLGKGDYCLVTFAALAIVFVVDVSDVIRIVVVLLFVVCFTVAADITVIDVALGDIFIFVALAFTNVAVVSMKVSVVVFAARWWLVKMENKNRLQSLTPKFRGCTFAELFKFRNFFTPETIFLNRSVIFVLRN